MHSRLSMLIISLQEYIFFAVYQNIAGKLHVSRISIAAAAPKHSAVVRENHATSPSVITHTATPPPTEEANNVNYVNDQKASN